MDKNNISIRLLISLIGLSICGMGVGIFLFSNLGVDPASVFITGLGNVLNSSYGTASAITNLVILIIIFIIDRKYISVSSLLAILTIGYTADFTSKVLHILLVDELNIVFRFILCILGTIILGIGISTYIRANLGVGAIDAVSEIISNKTKITYRNIRIIADLTFIFIGYLLGGSLGMGTIIAAFFTGPTVQFVRPFIDKFANKII